MSTFIKKQHVPALFFDALAAQQKSTKYDMIALEIGTRS